MPKGIDVLVSHSPPYGKWTYIDENWDVSTQYDRRYWKHLGSMSLRKAIIDKKPKLVVCGHIHSGDHGLNRIGDTALINCSLIDERYAEAYNPSKIEVVVCEDGSRKMRFKTKGVKKWETINQIGGAYDV